MKLCCFIKLWRQYFVSKIQCYTFYVIIKLNYVWRIMSLNTWHPQFWRFYFLSLLNLVKLGGEWVRYYKGGVIVFNKLKIYTFTQRYRIWHQLRKEIVPYLELEGWNWNILFLRGLWSIKFLLIKTFSDKYKFLKLVVNCPSNQTARKSFSNFSNL